MIPIDNTIVSDNLAEIKFVCDLKKCKGACCVEGDFGAPLLEEEIGLIEDDIEVIKPFMTEAGIKTIDLYGVFDYDFSGGGKKTG